MSFHRRHQNFLLNQRRLVCQHKSAEDLHGSCNRDGNSELGVLWPSKLLSKPLRKWCGQQVTWEREERGQCSPCGKPEEPSWRRRLGVIREDWLDEYKLVKVHFSSWGISKTGLEIPVPGILILPISASQKFLKTFHPCGVLGWMVSENRIPGAWAHRRHIGLPSLGCFLLMLWLIIHKPGLPWWFNQ